MSSALIGALRVTLGLDTAAFNKGLTEAQRKLNAAGADFQRAGERMKNVGRSLTIGITLPVLAFGASAIRAAGDFETAMNRTGAVSGATAEELAKLRDVAKEMGRTTQFSASEAASALGFLAMAGFDAQQAMDALPGTLQIAAAAQMDLAEAADLVSNVLTGYGMEVEDLARVNDVLAKTFTSSNTDLQMLGQSMKFVGPVASAAGVAFTETAAAIGLMGNAGIQGEMAGTALRGAISKILAPSKKAAGIMEELGLKFTDAEGRLIPLVDIVRQLEPHAEDAGLFMEIFGQRAGPAMAGLVSQGADALADLDTELQNSGGTAERVANAQMAGFNGAMKRLKSAFEGLQIAVAESGLLDFIGNMVSGLADLMTRMAEFSPTALRVGTVIAAIAAAVGPLLVVAGSLASAWGALLPVFGGIAAAMGTTGLVATLGALAAAAAPFVAAGVAIGVAWFALKDKLIPVLNQLRERFMEVLGPRLISLFETVKGALTELWGGPLGDAIRVVIDVLGDFAAAYTSVLGEGIIRILSALVSIVEGAFKQIVEVIKFVIAIFTGDWAGAWEAAKNIVTNAVDTLINVMNSLVPGAGDALKKTALAIYNWLVETRAAMIQGGKDIISGLVNGILAAPGKVADALIGVVKAGWEATKEFLGIASPSRLFMQVGRFISEGIASGVTNGTSSISRAFDSLNRMFEGQIAKTTANLERLLVAPLKKTASEAEKTLRELQENTLSILDRVFPKQAEVRSLEGDIATLERARGTEGVDSAVIDAAIAELRKQIDEVQNGDARKAAADRQEKLDEAAQQMRDDLDNLIDGLFPAAAEVRALTGEMKLLDDALAAGEIDPELHARARRELEAALKVSEEALRIERLASTEMGRAILEFGQTGREMGDAIMGALREGIGGRNVFRALKDGFSNVLENAANRALSSIEKALFGEGGLAGALDNLFQNFFQSVLGGAQGGGSGGGLGSIIGQALGSLFGGRASGGPVMANTPYIVGEKRREVFVPSTAGRIIPNMNELRGGGGATIYQNLTFSGAVDLATREEVYRVADAARAAAIQGIRQADRRAP